MTFRIGFVTGATPDKWARIWGDRSTERLELVPVDQAEQLHGVRDGSLSMALVRMPVDRDGMHLITLYEEVQVAVMSIDNTLTLLDELSTDDLAEEHQDWGSLALGDVVATVAAGTGVLVTPMSIARLHHRKDVTSRPVTDLEPTTVGLAWLETNQDPRVQTFIGIVRGRSARSSRD